MALRGDFIRPYGTHLSWGDSHPALKRWATIGCPYRDAEPRVSRAGRPRRAFDSKDSTSLDGLRDAGRYVGKRPTRAPEGHMIIARRFIAGETGRLV
jgi:hypothetical protein